MRDDAPKAATGSPRPEIVVAERRTRIVRVSPPEQMEHGLSEGAWGFHVAASGATIGATDPYISRMKGGARPDSNNTRTTSGMAQHASSRQHVTADRDLPRNSVRDDSATLLIPPFLLSTQLQPAASSSTRSDLVGSTAFGAAIGIGRQAMVMNVGAAARMRGGGIRAVLAASGEDVPRRVSDGTALARDVAPIAPGVGEHVRVEALPDGAAPMHTVASAMRVARRAPGYHAAAVRNGGASAEPS